MLRRRGLRLHPFRRGLLFLHATIRTQPLRCSANPAIGTR
jgi:hypothetical protein